MSNKYLVPMLITSTLLISGCGGGGGSGVGTSGGDGNGDNSVSYTVTGSAGTNGSIAPPSLLVASGATGQFTITADPGYSITSVSGCSGSLNGTTFTTGTVAADCTVTATFSPSVAAHEIIDPTPAASDNFGEQVLVLSNGNIVITDPIDSSTASNSGAVHLYDPVARAYINSIYGDDADDTLGSDGVYDLGNGNFVILSHVDDVSGKSDAGSAMTVNGSTGAIINTFAGNNADDEIGLNGVTVLGNGNFVVLSSNKGATDSGSADLIIGTTGVRAVSGFYSPSVAGDLDSANIVALDNNNYVIAAYRDDFGAVDGGIVYLKNGSTGETINIVNYVGDNAGDRLGESIVPLTNGNFAIASNDDDTFGGARVDAGSVILVNGSTGAEIASLSGASTDDRYGDITTALTNGNFVVASGFWDAGATTNGGVIELINGNTGALIQRVEGTAANNSLGGTAVKDLGNGNFVVISAFDDVSAVSNSGSIRLFNGTTGDPIGTPISGATAEDKVGDTALGDSVAVLENGNFVVASSSEDDTGSAINAAGSVRLIDGQTGTVVVRINGDVVSDQIGSNGVFTLGNNFVTTSQFDEVAGNAAAGSVIIGNGVTGSEIARIEGEDAGDDFGFESIDDEVVITRLGESHFVLITPFDNNGATSDAGSVRIIETASGSTVNSVLYGDASGDLDTVSLSVDPDGFFAIAGAKFDDNGSGAGSGRVFVLSRL